MQMTDDADCVDDGTGRGKLNQFDNLCDGVLNNLALVHGAVGEVKFSGCFRRMYTFEGRNLLVLERVGYVKVKINILENFFFFFLQIVLI